MRKGWAYGIWFVGAGVWLVVAALSLPSHMRANTLGALAVAVMFFAAGMYFSKSRG